MRLALSPPLDPSAYAYVHTVRTRFGETDAMGVVHHSVYPLYLEEARVAWMRDLGQDYTSVREGGVDLAVLELYVRHRAPLRFDDVLHVHLAMGKLTRATLQVGYLLEVGGTPAATAVTVHGCVGPDGRRPACPGGCPRWWPRAHRSTERRSTRSRPRRHDAGTPGRQGAAALPAGARGAGVVIRPRRRFRMVFTTDPPCWDHGAPPERWAPPPLPPRCP